MAKSCDNFLIFIERMSEIFRALLWEKAKEYKISPIQVQILLYVKSQPANRRCTSAMAEKMMVTPATISESIGNLIEKGLIESKQCTDDRRKNCFYLTAKGRRIANQICDWHTALSNTFLNGMTEEERETFNFLAYKILYQASKDNLIMEKEFCLDCKYFIQEEGNGFYCAHYNKTLSSDELKMFCKHFRQRQIKYKSHSGL